MPVEAKHLATVNQALEHSERLINTRGNRDDQTGTYNNGPCTIIAGRFIDLSAIEITWNGRPVLRAAWGNPNLPGHLDVLSRVHGLLSF